MKRMLINATQEEELRVALVDGQKLYDLDIENRTRVQKKASIFKGRITRVEPSLEAAFVDFGAERHGFLPLKEIAPEYFSKRGDGGRVNIKESVAEGTEVIVQVEKEERGNKGAALTTFVSLAGRYLVLMPNNPRAGGISRRIEGDERSEIREAINSLNIPDGMGIIVRTAGVGKNQEDLQWDLDYLMSLWQSIKDASTQKKAPFLIYQESNVIIRTIRDYLRQDIGEVLFDTKDSYEQALDFVRQVMPHYESRIKLYQEALPLFNRFQIEAQIESAFQREVKLPSGGSIVIDPTEALISIDINSSRATRGSDIEETALNTNLEAADEIARQLRLRDMGGLVVIDFIDMSSTKNQKDVENRMRDALEADRARVQVGRISRFGLLEMSRQRLRPSLEETSAVVCPRCNGQGMIRDVKSLCLSILRILQEEANKKKSAEIRAIVPLAVGSYLLNEKRNVVAAIEAQSKTRILIIPTPALDTPHYDIQAVSQQDAPGSARASFELEIEAGQATAEVNQVQKPTPVQQQAAVQAPTLTQAPAQASAPLAPAPRKKGLFGSLLSIFGLAPDAANDDETEKSAERTQARRSQGGAQGQHKQQRSNQGQGQGRSSQRGERGERTARPERGDPRTKSAEERKDGNKEQDKDTQSRRRGGGRNRGGAGTDDDTRKDNRNAVQADDSTQSGPADTASSGEGRRRRGERRPRNTTKRTRGPHPDGAETAEESIATVETAETFETATAADHNEIPVTVDPSAATAQADPLEASTNEVVTDSEDGSPKPRRRRSRGGSRRRGRKDTDASVDDAADSTEAPVTDNNNQESDVNPDSALVEDESKAPDVTETDSNTEDSGAEEEPTKKRPARRRKSAKPQVDPAETVEATPEQAEVPVEELSAAMKQEHEYEEQAVVEADTAASAETPNGSVLPEQTSPSAVESDTETQTAPEPKTENAPVASGGRAPNDPREIRRRRLEEEARKAAEATQSGD
jgi:ribonuclease E